MPCAAPSGRTVSRLVAGLDLIADERGFYITIAIILGDVPPQAFGSSRRRSPVPPDAQASLLSETISSSEAPSNSVLIVDRCHASMDGAEQPDRRSAAADLASNTARSQPVIWKYKQAKVNMDSSARRMFRRLDARAMALLTCIDNERKDVSIENHPTSNLVLDFQIGRNGEIQLQGKNLAHGALSRAGSTGSSTLNTSRFLPAAPGSALALLRLDDDSSGMLRKMSEHAASQVPRGRDLHRSPLASTTSRFPAPSASVAAGESPCSQRCYVSPATRGLCCCRRPQARAAVSRGIDNVVVEQKIRCSMPETTG